MLIVEAFEVLALGVGPATACPVCPGPHHGPWSDCQPHPETRTEPKPREHSFHLSPIPEIVNE